MKRNPARNGSSASTMLDGSIWRRPSRSATSPGNLRPAAAGPKRARAGPPSESRRQGRAQRRRRRRRARARPAAPCRRPAPPRGGSNNLQARRRRPGSRPLRALPCRCLIGEGASSGPSAAGAGCAANTPADPRSRAAGRRAADHDDGGDPHDYRDDSQDAQRPHQERTLAHAARYSCLATSHNLPIARLPDPEPDPRTTATRPFFFFFFFLKKSVA